MKISVHPALGTLPAHQYRDTFAPQEITNTAITSYAWSPIVWRGGVRRQENFLFANYAVLDVDAGMPIAHAIDKVFRDVCHIIGTTRSHGKEKNGVVCDRYRVIVPFVRPIYDLATYRHNMQLIVDEYDVDRACKDGGRFFYPCVEIVSEQKYGFCFDIERPPVSHGALKSPIDIEEKRYELESKRQSARTKKTPYWIRDLIQNGKLPGWASGRNHAMHRAAGHFALRGWHEGEIFATLAKSPIDRTCFTDAELAQAIRSALRHRSGNC